MKSEQLLRALGGVRTKYVDDAFPKKKPFFSSKAVKIGLAAASFVLLTLLNVWLFRPLPEVESTQGRREKILAEYKGSPYYDMIETMCYNDIHEYRPHYRNNFERLFSRKKYMPMQSNDAPSGRSTVAAEPDTHPEDTEGDLIKITDRYVFSLNGTELLAYEFTDGEQNIEETVELDRAEDGVVSCGTGKLRRVVSYDLSGWMKDEPIKEEFFLSEDGSVATVLWSEFEDNLFSYVENATHVLSLNVADPTAIRFNAYCVIDGGFCDARRKDGFLYIVTAATKRPAVGDYGDPSLFVPCVRDGEGNVIEKTARERILLGGREYDDGYYDSVWNYDVLTTLREDNAAVFYMAAVTRSSEPFTAFALSEKNAYLAAGNVISVFSHTADGGLSAKGEIEVAGHIKDRYCMDEQNGVLRAVADYSGLDCSGSLLCYDADTLEFLSSVTGFAPGGEHVDSVRFEGDTCYVCTATEHESGESDIEQRYFPIHDPVYFFDLSDPKNIRSVDTGDIYGFSSSLIELADGSLLGIGLEEGESTYDEEYRVTEHTGKIKVEVYRKTGNSVKSVCTYRERRNASYIEEYKSLFIDREAGLFGFPFVTDSLHYTLLRYDGKSLDEVCTLRFEVGSRTDHVRAFLRDGMFYVLAGEDVAAVELGNEE